MAQFVSDEFDGSAIGSQWAWENEAPTHSVSGGQLHLTSGQNTDFFESQDNGNFLKQVDCDQADLDIVMHALGVAPNKEFESLALMARKDSDNWLYAVKGYYGKKHKEQFTTVREDTNDHDLMETEKWAPDDLYYRLRRTETNSWATYVSANGTDWTLMSQFYKDLGNAAIGVAVFDGNSGEGFSANVDYVRGATPDEQNLWASSVISSDGFNDAANAAAKNGQFAQAGFGSDSTLRLGGIGAYTGAAVNRVEIVAALKTDTSQGSKTFGFRVFKGGAQQGEDYEVPVSSSSQSNANGFINNAGILRIDVTDARSWAVGDFGAGDLEVEIYIPNARGKSNGNVLVDALGYAVTNTTVS